MYVVEMRIQDRWRPIQLDHVSGIARVRSHRWASHYFRWETAVLAQGRLKGLRRPGQPLTSVPETRIEPCACTPDQLDPVRRSRSHSKVANSEGLPLWSDREVVRNAAESPCEPSNS
jgi:hypothetical protein